MPRGRSKRRLPDSLTQHLSDPKIVALRPRSRERSPNRAPGSVHKAAVSAVTVIVIVLAGGHMLHVW